MGFLVYQMKLIESLTNRKRIVLNVCGVLNDRTINSFYLNFYNDEHQKRSKMINIFVEDPILHFNSMILYLLLQLSYSMWNIYIPITKIGVISLRMVVKRRDPLILKESLESLIISGLSHGFDVLDIPERTPDVQVIRKGDTVKISKKEYWNLYKDLILYDMGKIESMEQLIDDEYVERLQGVLNANVDIT